MKRSHLFSTLFGLALVGCGNSPLFNHDNAGDLRAETERPVTAGSCPLKFPAAKLCASMEWTQGPSSEGEGAFTLRFWNQGTGSAENGPFVTPALTPFVQLWMPDMGHGSSPTRTEEVETGVFAVTSVYFIMPGAWDVRVQLKDAQGKVVEQDIESLEIH